MSNHIKNNKPKKDGRWKQGYVNPSSCKRLFESCKNEPIIYRSSWELEFMRHIDSNPNVKGWGSETGFIKYTGPDGKQHRYYPDFVVEFVDGTKWVIEVKPYNQTYCPPAHDVTAYKTFQTNYCKWRAAMEWCKNHGAEFRIVTERTIAKL